MARHKIVKPGEFERVVELARSQPGSQAIAVIVDADEDCPKTTSADLLTRGRPVAAGLPLSVVLAKIELEAWFIAGVESLRGRSGIRKDATPPTNPESINDAKAWLTGRMDSGRTYLPADNQAPFAQLFDYASASARSRSLKKFISDITVIGQLLKRSPKDP